MRLQGRAAIRPPRPVDVLPVRAREVSGDCVVEEVEVEVVVEEGEERVHEREEVERPRLLSSYVLIIDKIRVWD